MELMTVALDVDWVVRGRFRLGVDMARIYCYWADDSSQRIGQCRCTFSLGERRIQH